MIATRLGSNLNEYKNILVEFPRAFRVAKTQLRANSVDAA